MSTDRQGLTTAQTAGDANAPKNKSPRVRLLIAGAALALTGAVVGGIAVLNNSHVVQDRNSGLLADLGLKPITFAEAIQQSKDHNAELYWVGDLGVDQYSVEILNSGARDLRYLTSDPLNPSATASLLRVSVYPADFADSAMEKGPLHSVPDITTTNGRGDVITYNPTDLRTIVVKLSADYGDTKTSDEVGEDITEETIVLEFATEQSVPTLIQMSEKLVPIY